LQKDQAIALLLKKSNAQGTDIISDQDTSTKLRASFGIVNSFQGSQLNENTQASTGFEVDFSETLKKTKMVQRSLIQKQLFTGHTRIDLAQPLS
jgi:hypothetical protein